MIPGDQVQVRMYKWPDLPHWLFGGVYLGADQHGDWLGFPAGSVFTRPGATYRAPVSQVCLVPGPGAPVERGWLATFHAPGGVVRAYVDITTPARWEGRQLTAVDLDFDIVVDLDGEIRIEDADEFTEHRNTLGYPADLVSHAEESLAQVRRAVTIGTAPFDDTAADRWFSVLDSVRADDP